ncbi:MAG: protein kinase [Planctomycetaceae bacterium]
MIDASRDDRIADLLLRWEEEREKGNDVPIDQLCADCPELRDEVKQKIDALERMAWMSGDADEPPLPEVIAGRYKVERLLGQGGHGRVVLAFDTELERQVAIKIPHARLATLKEEARRIAKLRHDNIVAVHDVIEDDGQWFLVGAFIDGQSLAEIIANGPLEIEKATSLIATVAEALHHAHEQGFIHRDIKPANILIDADGRPFLTDFGIAVSSDEQSTDSLGTVAYMSPEQMAGEQQLIGPRSDIYSLGVVLYECLTGRLPYQVDTPLMARESVLFRHHLPPSVSNAKVGKWLNLICVRCLSKHPEGRYESAKVLAEALRSPKKEPFQMPSWLKMSGIFLCGSLATLLVLFALNLEPGRPVAVEKPISVVAENGALVFDGSHRIITPVESFAPCTLEAWFRTTGDRSEQFIIGSDIPNFYGIGIGINNNTPIVETIRGGFDIPTPIKSGEWTHIAAVYGPDETTLFLNGKKIGVGPATTPPSRPTHFVIGNVGEEHSSLHFHGEIRSVRISRGERYSADFEPPQSFSQDSDDAPHRAVLIYDGSSVAPMADEVPDLSGHENDGVIESIEP